MSKNASSITLAANGKPFWGTVSVLVLILGLIFSTSFKPSYTLFANDGPLAALLSGAYELPEGFTGIWLNQNWVGAHGGSAVPSVTFLLLALLGPIPFSKFYGPLTLLFFGIAVYVFCRQLRFRPLVCLLA